MGSAPSSPSPRRWWVTDRTSRTCCSTSAATMLYLDSSAAVKLYVAEAGSARVRAAVVADPVVVTVRVSFVEISAALHAATRLGRVADGPSVVAAFRGHWPAYVVVEVDRQLAESAADLAGRHALRAYDAVQLAAALAASGGVPSTVRFATFDGALARAAAAEGLQPGV
jgi:predicted nucleic acid-binding protein